MSVSNRDKSVIEKICRYCNEIDDAHNAFGGSYDNFKINTVYKNAVCLCLMQIGELSTKLSEEFKNNYSKYTLETNSGYEKCCGS